MRFLFFWNLIILAISSVKAQYTITATQKPTIGDVYSFIKIDTTNVVNGSSGLGQVWDYTNLSIPTTPTVLTTTYINATSIPNYTAFPGAYMAVDLSSNSSSFLCYDNDPNRLSINYLTKPATGSVYSVKYSDPYTKYEYPISYGSQFYDTVKYQAYDQYAYPPVCLPGPPALGSNSYTCSGIGTLNLPNNISLANTLKINLLYVKHQTWGNSILWADSTFMEEYYNSISKFPILTISHAYNVNYQYNPPVTLSNKNVYLNNSVVNSLSNSITKSSTVKIFPNPAKNKFQIHFNDLINTDKISNISLLNSLGQKVDFTSEIDYTNDNVIINLKDNNMGIYFVSLQFNGHFVTKKILVE